MRSYLKHRGAARDAWKLANWDEWLDRISMEFRPAIEHEVVDNSASAVPLQSQVADLIARIGAK